MTQRLMTLVALSLLACTPEPKTPTNTTPPESACVTDEAFFAERISPVLQSDCIACHVAGGVAAGSRNVLLPESQEGHLQHNRDVLNRLAVLPSGEDPLLLAKPLGRSDHTGGTRFAEESDEHRAFREFVARVAWPGGCSDPGDPPPVCGTARVVAGRMPLRRLTDVQVQNAIRDLLGVTVDDGVFPPTHRGEAFSTWPEANVVSAAGAEGVMLAAEQAAARAVARLDALLDCASGESQDACSTRFVMQFAERAYRRPLTQDERTTLTNLIATVTDPAERVGLAIEVVLQSPQFLYLDGAGTPLAEDPTVERLNDHAIAARLAAFFLESVPDEALRTAADEGRLHTSEQVRAEALRLLEHPRVLATVSRFHQDLAQLHQLDTIAKDAARYPQFNPEMVASMRTELDLFTTEVVWLGNPTLETLLYSPVTWTDTRLDAIYGTGAGRQGEGWQRRTLDPLERPGLLARTAFLTAHSYSATSAPVRRGAFMLQRLLCTDLTPPPGINLELPPPTETNTIRDRLAQHRANPSCASCHDQIDPLGFSMEHFGALGERRSAWDNGIPVDATGAIDGRAFDGLLQMLQTMDARGAIHACYAQQWYTFAHGRPVSDEEACSVHRVKRRFLANGGNIRDLLISIVTSDAFLHRPVRVLEETP